jgi:molecular chaperone GrpE
MVIFPGVDNQEESRDMTREENPEKGFKINDKRWWLKEDVDLDAIAKEAEERKPVYVEELEQRLEDKSRELQEFIQSQKTAKQKMEQAFRRLHREQDKQLEIERAKLAEPFLEVLDNLERLIVACEGEAEGQALLQGAQLVFQQVQERLTGLGLTAIQVEGKAFDPTCMEALTTTDVDERAEGQVVAEIRKGYALNERIVRPAGVQVGVAKRR